MNMDFKAGDIVRIHHPEEREWVKFLYRLIFMDAPGRFETLTVISTTSTELECEGEGDTQVKITPGKW